MRWLILLLVVTAAYGQSMYRWVDDKGVTHFSETPPADAKNAQKIEVKTTQPDRAPVDNWRERDQQSRQLRAKKDMEETTARQKEESQRERNCRSAQSRADRMRHASRVFRLDDKGERVWMEEKDRNAAQAEADADVAKYCR